MLKIAGAIEAIHIPIVASIILYLNWTSLPDGLRPSLASLIGTAIAAIFFGLFAAFYVLSL